MEQKKVHIIELRDNQDFGIYPVFQINWNADGEIQSIHVSFGGSMMHMLHTKNNGKFLNRHENLEASFIDVNL